MIYENSVSFISPGRSSSGNPSHRKSIAKSYTLFPMRDSLRFFISKSLRYIIAFNISICSTASFISPLPKF